MGLDGVVLTKKIGVKNLVTLSFSAPTNPPKMQVKKTCKIKFITVYILLSSLVYL